MDGEGIDGRVGGWFRIVIIPSQLQLKMGLSMAKIVFVNPEIEFGTK